LYTGNTAQSLILVVVEAGTLISWRESRDDSRRLWKLIWH
jgi:hypothetical protein